MFFNSSTSKIQYARFFNCLIFRFFFFFKISNPSSLISPISPFCSSSPFFPSSPFLTFSSFSLLFLPFPHWFSFILTCIHMPLCSPPSLLHFARQEETVVTGKPRSDSKSKRLVETAHQLVKGLLRIWVVSIQKLHQTTLSLSSRIVQWSVGTVDGVSRDTPSWKMG